MILATQSVSTIPLNPMQTHRKAHATDHLLCTKADRRHDELLRSCAAPNPPKVSSTLSPRFRRFHHTSRTPNFPGSAWRTKPPTAEARWQQWTHNYRDGQLTARRNSNLLPAPKVFNTAPSRTTPATSRAERAGTIPSKITTINSTRRRRVIRRDLSRIQRSAWSSNRPFVKVTLNFTLQKIDISRNLSQAVALQIRPTQRSYPSTENAIAVTTAVQQQRPEMQHKAMWPYVSRLYLPPFLGTNSFGALCRKPKDKMYICRVFAHHMREE